MRQGFRALIGVLALAVGGIMGGEEGVGFARFMNRTQPMPADRIIKNVEAWIKEKPDDAQAYYVLGRVHAMAWAYGAELSLIPPEPADGLPGFAPFQEIQAHHPDKPPTDAELDHLNQSLQAYDKAVTKEPKNTLFELGYACMLQEAATRAPWQMLKLRPGAAEKIPQETLDKLNLAAKALGDPEARRREAATATLREGMPQAAEILEKLRASTDPEIKTRVEALASGYWELQALQHYRKAYELALPADLKTNREGPGANSRISREAGEAILQILSANAFAAKPEEIKNIQASLETFKTGGRAVTPIIFALHGAQQIGELLDPDRHVSFDLAGDDVPREWPWLKPGTALLVWDPVHTGRITSGRQLFGSATWWIPFRDGYEALSVLDDNRDGMLTGSELEGIAVWVDQNGDGISQPGETRSLREAGVMSIGIRPQRDSEGVLMNQAGVRFADGRTVKTFDWVTLPAAVSEGGRP